MTDTIVGDKSGEQPVQAPQGAASEEQLIAMLVDRARTQGLQLSGEGGLLQQLTKRVLESALEGGITDHVGYDKHDASGRGSGNSRNGTRAKTVLTHVGPVEVKVPRDTGGTFEPQLVRKRQRRLTGVDEMVLSLSAKGLTHGRSVLIWPRSTARACPSRRSRRSPTRSWTAWPGGRAGRWTAGGFYS
nr:IS256 family transposase [Actinomadura madurae]